MGAEPKRKLRRKRTRRANLKSKVALKKQMQSFSKCDTTGRPTRPHTISPYTGEYRGKKLLKVKSDE